MQNRQGFAFSITLWIVASLLLATVVILRFAKDEVGLSRALENKLQTQMIAESVLESLKFYVPTADYTMNTLKNNLLTDTAYPLPSEMVVDGREYNVTKEIIISLQDTSGMLNVMYTSSQTVAKVLSLKESNNIAILKECLEDWKDTDDSKRTNGAEQNSYDSLENKRVVRNSKAIQDIHELKIIHGFEKIDFHIISKNFYAGMGTTVNLMLVNNAHYLAQVLNIDTRLASNMLELRQESPLQYMKNIMRLDSYNNDYMSFSLSKQFIVKIKVKKERALTTLTALVSFKKIGVQPYVTISYSIE